MPSRFHSPVGETASATEPGDRAVLKTQTFPFACRRDCVGDEAGLVQVADNVSIRLSARLRRRRSF